MIEAGKFPLHPARPRAYLWLLGAILLLAAILRVSALSDVAMTHDSFEYLDLAREIAHGEFFARDYPVAGGLLYSRQVPPLFPAAVAAVHRAGAPLETAGLIVTIICDLLAVGFAFAIGRRLGGTGAAVFAGLIAAGSLQHLSFSVRIITETMFGMWTLGTLWAALRTLEDPRPRRAAAAGAMAAAAYVTRENGLALVGLIAVTAAAWPWLAPRPGRATWLRLAAFFAAAFVIAALPFWIEVRVRAGHFGLSLRDSVLTQVLHPGGDEDEQAADGNPASTLGRRAGLAKIYLWRGIAPRFKRVQPWHDAWYVRVAFNGVMLAAVVLLFALDRTDRRRAALLLLWTAGFFVSTVLIAPLLFVPRYNYPAVIIIEALAGAGLAAAARAVGSRLGPRAMGAAFAVLTVLLAVHAFWTTTFVHEEGLALARKSAARGMEAVVNECRPKLDLPPRPRVMDAKIFAAYYLDGSFVPLPEKLEELGTAIAAARPDVVVIDSRAIQDQRPALEPLITGPTPDWLRLRCEYSEAFPGKTIRFFTPPRHEQGNR